MAGTINSLGIGSGVLTADVIDKLKENDKSLSITPIDNKITLANQKKEALSLLDSLLTTFKSSVNALDDDLLYQKRSVSGSNSAINVTADSGVAIQSFSITDTQMAQKHVMQSGSFNSSDSYVASGSGTMTLSIDGKNYAIDYTGTTTLEDLKTAINNKAGEKVQASVLQVGTNDYRLIMTSKETGSNQQISITDSGTLNYSLYQTKDILESLGFTSDSSLVASGAVAQSTQFSLNQTLVDEGLSVTINGTAYSVPFNGTHAQTLNDFKSALESSNLFNVTVSGNDITLTAKTAGVPYTIDSAFQTSDTPAIASTTHISNLAAQSEEFNLNADIIAGESIELQLNGQTYTVPFNTDHTQTMQDLKTALEAGGLYSVALNGQSFTVTSNTPGTAFTVDSYSVLNSSTTLTNTQLSAATLQSDQFNLDQELTSESLSIEINGKIYSAPFNGSHAQTLTDFKSLLEADGFTLNVSGNSMTLSSSTAYTINTAFTATDSTAIASTTTLASNVTPSGTYNVTMNGTTYNIAYDKDTTLSQLAERINSAVGSTVATIHQVGTSYKLQLQSTAAGDDPTLAVSDTGGYLSTKLTSLAQSSTTASTVQTASDASFKYNGITMTRSSNEITDIITGVTINLLQNSGSSNITISQNVDAISSEISGMATAYNTLMDQLGKMTLADLENGKVGIFNGDSSITSIRREITRMVTSVNANGQSLSQYGLDLSEKGYLSFDTTSFKNKFTADPEGSELFFSGKIVYNDQGNETSKVDGIYTQLNALMERYTGSNGIMDVLTSASKDEIKTMTENRKRTLALLDARYDSMTLRFIEYDSIISKLNSQFSSLQQQIQMAINSR